MIPAPIAVTGFGLVSAAGSSAAALAASLERQQPCLRPIAGFDPSGLRAKLAGEVDFDPLDHVPPIQARTLDRGTQLAIAAARQALDAARLDATARSACGVAVGVSGSPQYQNMPLTLDRRYPVSRQSALYAARTTPAFQADMLARRFGLGGPRFAFGSASLGGLLALSHAMDLLRAGHAPAMLVGGGEIQTLANALGMDALGVTAAGACKPFGSGSSGMCFGDGAAFFVLELLAEAERRGATLLGELGGAGLTADAYHELAPDPSGSGLARAVRLCLDASGAAGSIGWIRSCGTGHRPLDTAEAFGLRTAFDGAPPPVTSTEPYFSHVNGVSPLLGLAAVLVAQQTDRAPAVPDPDSCRPGLGIALLPPGKLPAGDCLLTVTAFGGTNGALVVRSARAAVESEPPDAPRIVIAGIGAVSALGATTEDLLDGLSRPRSGDEALLVQDDWLQRKLPGVALHRRERLVRMALLAVAEALASAGLKSRNPGRFGVLVGLTHGQVGAYAKFFEHIMQGRFDITTGRLQLQMSRFSLASEIAQTFGLTGYSGAMAPGVHGGVQLLAHGAEVLAASADLDGLLVVAADEWTALKAALYRALGALGNGAAYEHDATGCVGGEGAAAILLCRRQPGESVASDWASIAGSGFAGDTTTRPDPAVRAYRRAIATALRRAGADTVDLAVGQGCGWPAYDRREQAALQEAAPGTTLVSVLPRTGLAEGAGGLFGAIAASAALRGAQARRALLLGSSERGAHAAVVLARAA